MISKCRVVFFDLDGTMHQQDIFGSFLFYLMRKQILNLLFVLTLFPIIGLAFLIIGRSARWPMSLLLWGCTFGHSEKCLKKLEEDFVHWFRNRLIIFPKVHKHLNSYLLSNDTDVWLITGSPQSLVERVYFDAHWLSKVHIIGTKISRANGGWVLNMRCLGHEKVVQLENRIGKPLQLYSGYSDSKQDDPLFYFCQYCWRVSSNGKLNLLNK